MHYHMEQQKLKPEDRFLHRVVVSEHLMLAVTMEPSLISLIHELRWCKVDYTFS
jgi:hypothetical protein